MRKTITLIAFFLCLINSHSQKECFDSSVNSFQHGEKLYYELDYHWGLIWVSAGEIVFTSKASDKGYHLVAYGKSKSNWNWFYPVLTKYEAKTNKDYQPYYALRAGNEGSHFYNDSYTLNGDSIFYESLNEKGELETKKSYGSEQCARDVISAIYNFRNLDYDNYEVDQTINFKLLLDGKIENSYLRYGGKTKWKNPITKEKTDVFVLKPKLVEGTVFKSGENMTVYISADEYRIPLYIETKLIVGKAKILLRQVEGSDTDIFRQ